MATFIRTAAGLWINAPLIATQESEPHLDVAIATTVSTGVVKPDGTSITIDVDGTIHATGGGPGGFPSVVGAENFTGQTATLNFVLLPSPTTGDYVLNDFFIVTTSDAGAIVAFEVDFATETGPAAIDGVTTAGQMVAGIITSVGAIAAAVPATVLGSAFPSVIHAVGGTPISISITVDGATTLVFDYHATLVQNQ